MTMTGPTPSDAHVARPSGNALVPAVWLATFVAFGVLLAVLYPDSYQQDGGTHFLFARDAWWNHVLFVDVWGRPLFTTLYALPALAGYLPAKLCTVVVCALTAWHTYRWAADEGMPRAELAIPFLVLQPAVMLLASDTMTEPLFALVFVLALRLHRSGRIRAGMCVAALLPLARPEGFFICLLWGVWLLADARLDPAWWRRALALPILAGGVAAWWLASVLITRDPAFLLHNWPSNWSPTGAVYGVAPWLEYWSLRYDIVSRALFVPFAVGLVMLLARRRLGTATSSVLLLFVVHSVLRHYGLFGSAGYPRYFVCVAPAFAVITLAGWNEIAGVLSLAASLLPQSRRRWMRGAITALAVVVLFLATRTALYAVDDHATARDARAVIDANDWLRAHPVPVRQLVWSQAYMCILRRCDTRHRLVLTGDRAHNLALLRATGPGTLAFWDGETGPGWYGVRGADFEAAGFRKMFDQHYDLYAQFGRRIRYPAPWVRSQEMMLYYKPGEVANAEEAGTGDGAGASSATK